MEINLSPQLNQKLTITPQLKQALSVLCLNNMDLINKIQEAVSENPFLEVEESSIETEKTEFKRDTNIVWDYHHSDDDDDSEPGYLSTQMRNDADRLLFDLLDQINFTSLKLEDQRAVQAIIKNLNDNGFFDCSIEQISTQNDLSLDCLKKNLSLVRSLDPAGIAAKDFRHCLLIQLERYHPTAKLALNITANYLAEVAKKDFQKLANAYSVDEKEIIAAVKLIQSLNPRPIVNLSNNVSREMIPDLKLIRDKKRWLVQLNEENLPNLGISNFYLDLINRGEYDSKQEKQYLTRKYKDAGWFLQAIYQRKNTIKRVAEVIISVQLDFFTNSKDLKPLKLSDIASQLEIHESTVSRAVQDKFIATPKGIYPLKFFLRNSVSTLNGTCSNQEIQNMIKEIVASEVKPLSDQSIAEALEAAGYNIARRTVSKYRDILNIPSARMRKKEQALK